MGERSLGPSDVDLDGDVAPARLASRSLEKDGKLDDARSSCSSRELSPERCASAERAGGRALPKGRYDEAVQFLGRARGARPERRSGLVCARSRPRGATRSGGGHRRLPRVDPCDARFADAQKDAGRLLATMGEHEQAILVLDDLLRLERTNEQAAANREVLAQALDEMLARRLLGRPSNRSRRRRSSNKGGSFAYPRWPPSKARRRSEGRGSDGAPAPARAQR